MMNNIYIYIYIYIYIALECCYERKVMARRRMNLDQCFAKLITICFTYINHSKSYSLQEQLTYSKYLPVQHCDSGATVEGLVLTTSSS